MRVMVAGAIGARRIMAGGTEARMPFSNWTIGDKSKYCYKVFVAEEPGKLSIPDPASFNDRQGI